jgi:hypothetical protein
MANNLTRGGKSKMCPILKKMKTGIARVLSHLEQQVITGAFPQAGEFGAAHQQTEVIHVGHFPLVN